MLERFLNLTTPAISRLASAPNATTDLDLRASRRGRRRKHESVPLFEAHYGHDNRLPLLRVR